MEVVLPFLGRTGDGLEKVEAAPAILGGGFNGGPDRTLSACRTADPAERARLLERAGFSDAELVHRAGGNMLRVFYSISELLGQRHTEGSVILFHVQEPCYMASLETRLERLQAVDNLLDRTLQGLVDGVTLDGKPLPFADHDAYLGGVERFNDTLEDMASGVRVLLTALIDPPRWILEAPSAATLQQVRCPYTFASLWKKYLLLQTGLTRRLIQRYLGSSAGQRGPSRPRAVCAFEVANEPDYEWLPDELRIERSSNSTANPLGKYVTELHLDMIPNHQRPLTAFEATPWGFRTQDAEWEAQAPKATSLHEFDWGAKFDWYVKCFAELHEHLSWVIRDQAQQQEADVTVVSGSVTHCNVDFLRHLYRLNPNVFAHVDVIGLHPYHWVRHNIWDQQFVSPTPKDDWRTASPRAYARDYCKRFDFLEEVAQLVRLTDAQASFGLAGKRIWVTEFGIPTKKLGTANLPDRAIIRFIRQRHEPELEFPSVVWEELWDAFFTQVDRSYLERHGVEVFLFYALRELDWRGLDLHDDDRSNLAIFRTDGQPRMQAATYERMTCFLSALTRRPAA